MKLAIMQPYFFPYIGYFSLIQNTDYFVFFDTPQYIRKGWINRNRILGANGKDIYFTVPIEKTHREAAIQEVKISYRDDWKTKIIGQLSVYKKRAPYYNDVMELINDVLDGETEYISELAIKSVVKSCEYLGMDLEYNVYSKMDMPDFDVKAPDEWALYITKYMRYDTYVNPPGGKVFFDSQKYIDKDIDLQFLTQELQEYNQRTKEFIPGLSIIDIMMFCAPDEIVKMMERYTIE